MIYAQRESKNAKINDGRRATNDFVTVKWNKTVFFSYSAGY